MDAIFFHPKVVHLPLGLAIVMPFVAVSLLVAWRRGWFSPRTWFLAVGLQAVLVLGGWIALRSGEQASESVEDMMDHGRIHEHEEAAETFVWVASAVLALMAVGAWRGTRSFGFASATAATVGTAAVMGLAIYVGHLGGRLVYEDCAPMYQGAKCSNQGSPETESSDEASDAADDDANEDSDTTNL